MDKIFVHYCKKCKHYTAQTYRTLGQPVGDTGVFDLEDVGDYVENHHCGRLCLNCGTYYSDGSVIVEEKLRVIR